MLVHMVSKLRCNNHDREFNNILKFDGYYLEHGLWYNVLTPINAKFNMVDEQKHFI